MNKYLIVIFAGVLLTFSCKGNKTGDADVVRDSDKVVADTTPVDTMEQLISESPMPKTADELFDDFFFNFAANKTLQMKRIKFPLEVIDGQRNSVIEKGAWKMDHFFMRQGYYTLIFDSKRQMEVVKDTNINHVVVEKISFAKRSVKQYVFDRVNGLWMMQAIQVKPLYQNNNASFLKFYQRFACDTAYQVRHVHNPVKFVTDDPDDEFKKMTGLLTPDTWPAFAPELPSRMIYNIIYGQTYKESTNKVFVLRGIANGLEVEISFSNIRGKWQVTELNQ